MANSAFDAMAVATESLGTEIHRKATHSSIWQNLIPRGTYKNGTGFVQTTFTVENSLPTSDTEAWTELTSSSLADGSADNVGNCDTTWNDTKLGYSTRTYKPETYNLRGPMICSTDLIFEHNVNSFLSAYVQELTKRSKFSIDNKLQNTYAKLAKKAMLSGSDTTAAVSYTAGGTDVEGHTAAASNEFGSSDPSAVDLEQSHLDLIAQELIEEGATEGDSNGWITLDEAGPVFPLLIGMEASNKIVKNSGSDYRNDLRYGAPNELLKRLGASRVLGNFRHIPQVMPMRYTWDDTNDKFVRVNQYTEGTAGGGGKKYTINSAWKTATHEAAVVLNPAVYTAEAVRPVTNAGGLNWNPQDYNGNWKWVTGLNNISDSTTAITTGTDPFQKLGRHYCEYMFAMKPVRPDDGMVIIFKR